MAEENILQDLIDRMTELLQQLVGGEAKESDGFTLEEFWMKIRLGADSLSCEVTKVGLLYSKNSQPSVSDSNSVLRSIEAHYMNILNSFYSLPKEKGILLRKEVHTSVVTLTQTLVNLLQSVKNKSHSEEDRVKLVGCIWEACEAFSKLPQNNHAATLQFLEREEMLVIDALMEIEEEVKTDLYQIRANDVDNAETWNNQDRELLPPCMGLVKTARSCLKRINIAVRTNGKCAMDHEIAQLDDLASSVKKLSPAVDNFIWSIYPPMNRQSVHVAALEIVNKVQEILHLAEHAHYITNEDHTWIQFLLRAVDYNNNKLQPLLNH